MFAAISNIDRTLSYWFVRKFLNMGWNNGYNTDIESNISGGFQRKVAAMNNADQMIPFQHPSAEKVSKVLSKS